ncbi:MAG: MFS transporter [Alphaproteobacteria bacterium]|nr:MFS transporter [Alphaproteobacteria bacterium]MBU0799090.1 MFS transporter [Alphaproteobacteria bacterium]MBU0885578.1 MFS transporter [Alphaproteobacteria bacterium]MBU1813767.1 MFS transporter [Alphaproteobacteria bacterium]
MTSLPSSAIRPFFGWHVVAATFLLAIFGWGVGFYGPPVFLYAVVARTGWPVAMVSAAVTAHFLVGAVVVANLPRLYRRIGVPQVTVLGASLLAVGVLGWAVAQQPWQLFLAAFASGAGWVAMGAAAVNALIAPWFSQRRPAALGMAYNGASLGGVIFSPLWIALISTIGFAPAALAVGGIMVLVVVLLAVRVFSRTPESLGQAPDGNDAPIALRKPLNAAPPVRQSLWRDRRFLTLAAGIMLGLFAQIGLLAHLFSLLVPVLGEAVAGLAMGGATLAAIAGRSAVGWLMPASADRRLVACLSHGVQLLGSLLFMVSAGDNGPWLFLGIVLFGLGIGNATSLPPLIAQTEFAPIDAARVVPLIVAIGQAGYAFAPAIFGLLRSDVVTDGALTTTGGGTLLFAAAAVIQLAAIICYLAGRGR